MFTTLNSTPISNRHNSRNTTVKGIVLNDYANQLVLEHMTCSAGYISLFKNNHYPDASDTLDDYEITESLSISEWQVRTGKAVADDVTFSFEDEMIAYGYVIVDEKNHLLWAERFSGAPLYSGGGGSISVRPVITLT